MRRGRRKPVDGALYLPHRTGVTGPAAMHVPSSNDPQSATDRGRLVFVVTEDWFFVSHFLPMARAAVAMGLDVAVVTRVGAHADAIRASGARVIPLQAERASFNLLALAGQVRALTAILRAERPDIVHAIALRSIVVAGIARRLAGVAALVHALTGLGFLGARGGAAASLVRLLVRRAVTGPLAGPGSRFLFENPDDPATLGLDPADASRVTIVGGAGIDPDALKPAPPPAMPPLRVALVARMLWSKGIDLAVEAVTRARSAGADVTLSLYGAPDPANPKAVPEATLRQWSARPGIVWHGPTRDIAAVWAGHHVAILPSRGGEGLPRTILEAAACGRAVLTTDVPGCRTFVRDGVEGRVVPAGDADALARVLVALAADPARVAAMGAAARARVLDGHKEADVMAAVQGLYAACLRNPGRP